MFELRAQLGIDYLIQHSMAPYTPGCLIVTESLTPTFTEGVPLTSKYIGQFPSTLTVERT